jgi:L-iditol 2-dehydrogenase
VHVTGYGVVWPSQGVVEIEEVEPGKPGPGQVLIDTAYSQISPGTERTWLLGIDPMPWGFPFRPGYCLSGVISAVGDGVEDYAPGDRVVAVARHASAVVTGTDQVLHVPDEVDLKTAVFFHLAFVALLGTRRAQIQLGEPVAVLGLGPIGLLALRAARLQGAVPVIAMDIEPSRLARAPGCGADLVVDASDAAAVATMIEQTGGPAAVIEVTGAHAPMRQALEIVQRMGRVVLLTSRHGESQVDLHGAVHLKGVTIIGAQTMARPRHDSRPGLWTWRDDARAFLDLLRYRHWSVDDLVTHVVPARQASIVYELVAAADPSVIGALLDWS